MIPKIKHSVKGKTMKAVKNVMKDLGERREG